MAAEQPITLEQLGKRLRALPKEISARRGGPLAFALRKVANTVRDEAKRNAPVGASGRLQSAVIVKRDTNPKQINNAVERFVVGISRKRAFYGLFVHDGTEVGKQGPDNARPFVRDAYESTKDKMVSIFTTELQKGMDRAVARAKRAG